MRYMKVYRNFVHCMINAAIEMLTKWFHRDEKILIFKLSSSVVCLSLTIVNIFENI